MSLPFSYLGETYFLQPLALFTWAPFLFGIDLKILHKPLRLPLVALLSAMLLFHHQVKNVVTWAVNSTCSPYSHNFFPQSMQHPVAPPSSLAWQKHYTLLFKNRRAFISWKTRAYLLSWLAQLWSGLIRLVTEAGWGEGCEGGGKFGMLFNPSLPLSHYGCESRWSASLTCSMAWFLKTWTWKAFEFIYSYCMNEGAPFFCLVSLNK